MLLTTAAIAVGKKIQDKRRNDKEAKQGVLRVGDSDVARRAFANQTQKTITQHGSGTSGIQRAGIDVKFEHPSNVEATSPATSSTPSGPLLDAEKPGIRETRTHTPEPERSNTVNSETGRLAVATPVDDQPRSPRDSMLTPYSPSARSSTSTAVASLSTYSRDWDGYTLAASSDTRSIMSGSSSQNGNVLRIRTKGTDLKSGYVDLTESRSVWHLC